MNFFSISLCGGETFCYFCSMWWAFLVWASMEVGDIKYFCYVIKQKGGDGDFPSRLCHTSRRCTGVVCVLILAYMYSVYEKLQATRAKVVPVNLIYGTHFSATKATCKVSQNMGNFVEFTRITHKPVTV